MEEQLGLVRWLHLAHHDWVLNTPHQRNATEQKQQRTMQAQALPTDLERELTKFGVDSTDPITVLEQHIDVLPRTLLVQLGEIVAPRDRSRIPRIRQRRHVWAHSQSQPSSSQRSGDTVTSSAGVTFGPAGVQGTGKAGMSGTKPTPLTAAEGRVRWPLLWEQLGGDPTSVPETEAQASEAEWVKHGFMPGSTLHVGKLGAMLSEQEEMEAWESAAKNRARERRLESQGEEFDESSDEDEGDTDQPNTRAPGAKPELRPAFGGAAFNQDRPLRDQKEVEEEFERRLLELFLDGLDTIDYDEIDFETADDPIASRDQEDAYFDDEAPSHVSDGAGNGHGKGHKAMENGQGEYDY